VSIEKYSIIVVGAGAAGVGLGVVLEKCGIKDYVILERDTIGASFAKWPSYTRFISPSFTGNFFNAIDLNAISPDTSPAFNLKTEHPSGKEYATYLELVAKHFGLNIKEHTTVIDIKKDDNDFIIATENKKYQSQFVIWAGGDFSNPILNSFPGAEQCVHSSQAEEFPKDEYTIIGGYESGMELSAHLLSIGKTVTVIDAEEPWEIQGSDSSISIAPATFDRLKPFIGTRKLRFFGNTKVTGVTKIADNYEIMTNTGENLLSPTIPILATGFYALPTIVKNLFEQNENSVVLGENDESTITPGLFLAGPRVKHGGVIFCFIYKFRQRLPIIVDTIAERLNLSTDGLEEYKKANFYLKDLSCCTDECTC